MVSAYSKGLAHGYEDAREQAIHDKAFLLGRLEAILDARVTDEQKIRQLRRLLDGEPS